MPRIVQLNFHPETENLIDRIRSLSSYPNIDRVDVSLPIRSPVRPEALAFKTREAEDRFRSEEGIDLTIWVNSFFEEAGPTFIP